MNDLATLSDYRNIAFQLAGDLEAFHDLAEDLHLAAILPQIDDLLARVRSHTFRVAVVGEFKRGKSTFINALLGREVLPADVAPASATLNRVTYGHEPKVRVYYRGSSGQPDPHEDIAINQLAEFVTKLTPEAEAIASRVREAVVYYPLPYLQTNNLDLIDTPGLNDETGQTEITMGILGRVDAAIMVLMATSPFAESERIFLDQLLAQGLGRMIFVVTGLDRLATADQRERVMQHISNGIVETIRAHAARRYGVDTPEYSAYLRRYDQPLVCGLSGYQALLALQQNDQTALDESGLPAFNRALGRYMTYERGAQMLLTQASQIARFGEVMRQALELQVVRRRARQQQADTETEVGRALLESLRALGQVELRRLNAVTERAKTEMNRIAPLCEKAIRQAMQQAVDTAPITAADLEIGRYAAFATALANKILAASRVAVVANTPRLLKDLEAVGRSEKILDPGPLVHFALTLDYTLRFVRTALGVALEPTPTLQTRLGQPAGFGPPEASETPVDLVSFDPTAASAIFNLPDRLVPAALQAVAQPLAQQRNSVTWQIAEPLRASNYRGLLRRAILKEIDAYYRAAPLLTRLQALAQTTFEALQQHVTDANNEVQDMLGELRAQCEREGAMAERDLDGLEHARLSVQEIVQRANDLQRRSEELLDLADQFISRNKDAG